MNYKRKFSQNNIYGHNFINVDIMKFQLETMFQQDREGRNVIKIVKADKY